MSKSRYFILQGWNSNEYSNLNPAVLVEMPPDHLQSVLALDGKLEDTVEGWNTHCLRLWCDSPVLIDISSVDTSSVQDFDSNSSAGSELFESLSEHLLNEEVLEVSEELFQKLTQNENRRERVEYTMLEVTKSGVSWDLKPKYYSSYVKTPILQYSEIRNTELNTLDALLKDDVGLETSGPPA